MPPFGAPDDQRELQQTLRDLARAMEALQQSVRDAARSGGAFGSTGPGLGPAQRGSGGGGAGGGGLGALGAAAGPAGAVEGLLADNIVTNTFAKATREFAIDTVAGVAGDAAKFGFGAGGVGLQNSITWSALRAGGNIPIIGDLFEQVSGPVEAAAARTTASVSDVYRAGGTVSDEAVLRTGKRRLGEEIRARQGQLQVERVFKNDPEMLAASLEGTRMEKAIDALVDAVPSINAFSKAVTDAQAALERWLSNLGRQ